MRFSRLIVIRSTLALALAGGALTLSGCGKISGNSTTASISESDARQALTSALDAWKSGKPPSQLANQKPAVQVVDSKWSSGAKLQGYEVVSAETLEGGTMRLTTKLDLKAPAKPQEEKYSVYGKDPVWILSDADFTRNVNMDNPSATGGRPKR